MSGLVWPPPGVTPAVPAEKPTVPRSKPWLRPAPRGAAILGTGLRLLIAPVRRVLASLTATTKPADRPATGAPPP